MTEKRGVNADGKGATPSGEDAAAPAAGPTRPSPEQSPWLSALPAACAIHCLLTPVAAAALPMFALAHRAEGFLWAGAGLMALPALTFTWRTHGRIAVWAVALAGLALWGASILGWLAPAPENLTSPLGGLTVAGALFWNGRLRHRAACRDCGCALH